MPYSYRRIHVETAEALATVTLDNPPANVITEELYSELAALIDELDADRSLGVIVIKSADPAFFMAHFDVELLLQIGAGTVEEAVEINESFQAMLKKLRTMDKVVIGQIEGRVGGGGAEIAMNFDMRFGVKDKTIFNQMEVPLGILPGGSGTQMLPRLVGRGRAMEIILGAGDIDAETAERWGLLNRIFPADEIDDWTRQLAQRISQYPAAALSNAKRAINCAEQPLADGLGNESELFLELLFSNNAIRQMERFMTLGGQTRALELRMAELSQAVCGRDTLDGDTD